MGYNTWKTLSVRGIIPALDPNNEGSMMNKAKTQAEDAKAEIQQKQDVLNSTVSKVNDLMNTTHEAVDKLNEVSNLINSDTSINYNEITGTGQNQFVNEVGNSLNATSAPTIDASTEVGAVTLLVTVVDSAEVESKMSEIRDILAGVK